MSQIAIAQEHPRLTADTAIDSTRRIAERRIRMVD
jgi:hypothetical protein